MDAHSHLISQIRESAIKLVGKDGEYGPLLEMIGDARFVLIGEETHGSKEFYSLRSELTKLLIKSHNFAAVAVEGDWPDCYRVNKYVRGDPDIGDASSALSGFTRFPSWMWRNEVIMEFIDWLRQNNKIKALPQEKTGFYGLDLYSLHASIEAVIAYLDKVDPPAAIRARHYYGCFDQYNSGDPQKYGYTSNVGMTPTCEREVIQQLIELRQHAHKYMKLDGFIAEEEFFCAEQNAKVVADAEKYYRAMFQIRVSSWNLRDRHMMETLNALATHLSDQRQEEARIVVWAHNSHVGDARATEAGEQGEWNIGQLVREEHGLRTSRLIGFTTYSGFVTAASEWDGEAESKVVCPAMEESYEALFHGAFAQNFLLILRGNEQLCEHLRLSRLQRAIGVLYLPQTERQSHYFFSRLPEQFDAIIHIDTTTALRPLERTRLWYKDKT